MVGPDVALAASNLLLGTAAGARVSQSLFVVPRRFDAPPASLEAVRDRRAARFWGPLQLGTAVALAVAIAMNRRDAARRPRLLVAAACHAATVGAWTLTLPALARGPRTRRARG